jgi:hypothetical protein
VLVRPSSEPFLVGVLTSLFVVLLVLAAIASFIDLRRKESHAVKARPAPLVVVSPTAVLSAMEQRR